MRRSRLIVACIACAWSTYCTAFSNHVSSNRFSTVRQQGDSSSLGRMRVRRSSALELRIPRKEGEITAENGCHSRSNFIRSAAVGLAVGSWTIFGGRDQVLAVGVQPGERTTAPPNALLLVPALRAKVTSLLFTYHAGQLIGPNFTPQTVSSDVCVRTGASIYSHVIQ